MPVYVNCRLEYSELHLGQNIREHRRSRGWTLQELASRLSISPANLSAIENEKAPLDVERLVAIAEAFGIRPREMFPKSGRRHFHITRHSALESVPTTPFHLLDRDTGNVTTHPNTLRPLADPFVGKHLEPFYIEVHAIPEEEIQFISHHREEFLFVIRGSVECLLQTPDGPVREILVPGDCLYFQSNLPHCIRSANRDSAYVIDVVHSPFGTSDSERSEATVCFKDSAPKNFAEEIANQVAALREARGMSMSEFASALNISVRQLADIERGRKSLPIESLLAACRRFRKPLDYFLSTTILERPFYFVQRASEIGTLPIRNRRRLVDGGWSQTEFRSLAAGFGARNMFPYYVKLRHPGKHHPLSLHEHHGQEFIYVLNGEVTLVTLLDGERCSETLVAGDSCFIDSTVPHRFVGMSLSPYDEASAEIIDVYWCPLGEGYLFKENQAEIDGQDQTRDQVPAYL
ncbi:MAG: transcriptional regulator, MerR family [Candidatus Solibacter sp.]|nr:transcriptional regulator, MerR family [Candidatus Solibacter sp.]